MHIIFSNDIQWCYNTDPDINFEFYPEQELTITEQLNFTPNPNCEIVLTSSPFIVAAYDRSQVSYVNKDGIVCPVEFQTFGTSHEIILKQLTGIASLQPAIVVKKIRDELTKSDEDALEYIKTQLGDSMERAYLIRKLSPK